MEPVTCLQGKRQLVPLRASSSFPPLLTAFVRYKPGDEELKDCLHTCPLSLDFLIAFVCGKLEPSFEGYLSIVNSQTIKPGILCYPATDTKGDKRQANSLSSILKIKAGSMDGFSYFFFMFSIGWFCHQGDQIPTLAVLDIRWNINPCFCANGHHSIIT